MLPSRRMIPWWFVVVVLYGPQRCGPCKPQRNNLQPIPMENQHVEGDYSDEPRSEEATLLEDLQVRG